MKKSPNILFLMADQMLGRALDPDHPCKTPNFDHVAARGLRFPRAYPPNPVCSPSRASLMTGLLPHNHGVVCVTHCVDDDQAVLRTEYPHWAQKLETAGYRTGYFGKWHVERSEDLRQFGWQQQGLTGEPVFAERRQELADGASLEPDYALAYHMPDVPGYRPQVFYGVTRVPAAARNVGVTTSLAADFLDEALADETPWCCFASVTEPHDPYICGEEAFALYDVDAIDVPPNWDDDLQGRPNIYRRSADAWKDMTQRQKKEAAACYYASISEIDAHFGTLIDKVEAAGKLDETIIVITSDHGDMMGAHGLYCKNIGAFEEAYDIPMTLAGPGIAVNAVSSARVGLHDLPGTLLELVNLGGFDYADSRAFTDVCHDPAAHEADWQRGYAEYDGQRVVMGQRVVWDGPWKLVFNAFDYDELYNLDDDPYEMHNLVHDPAYAEQYTTLTAQMWQVLKDTNNHSLYNSQYPPYRLSPVGPLVTESE